MSKTTIRLPVAPPSQVHPKRGDLDADADIALWLDAQAEAEQLAHEDDPDLIEQVWDGPFLASMSHYR